MSTPARQSDPNEQLWRELDHVNGDGDAARAMLAAGLPIYYREPTTPKGLPIQEIPR